MENIRKMNLNLKKIGIGCASALMFGIIFGWVVFPKILSTMLARQVALKPGSDMREMWTDIPFPLDFRIYVFNTTNPDDVIGGGKPNVQEIGPFFFEEYKTKFNLEDDATEDTVSYDMKNKWIFRPDKSNGLTGEELITIPHMLLQGIVLAVKRERAPMLPLVSKAIKEIFPHATAFLTAPFLDIFFRGIPIDCSSHSFSAKAVCSAFDSDDVKGIIKHNETTYLFSIFGTSNDTSMGKFTAYRGIKNAANVGRVVRFNDELTQDVWDGDKCNEFVGTDSTIFPPSMPKEQGLWAFTPDLCRSMGAKYEGKSSYGGIPTLQYGLDLGDIKADESLHCFCTNPPDGCPVKGTMDLMPCIGAPLVASMPHFYHGDASLLSNVNGLNPNRKDHAVSIQFEIISGTPVSAAKRLQFNLDTEPVEEVEQMNKLRKLIMPLFWVEEGAQLNKTYVNMLKYQLFLVLKINSAIKWLCVIIGGTGVIMAAFLQYHKTRVAPKPPTEKIKPVTVANKPVAKEHVDSNGLVEETVDNNSKYKKVHF